MQRHLSGRAEATYLRQMENPPAGSVESRLQRLADQSYAVLLAALQWTFTLRDRAAGALLEQSRRAMLNLHEVYHLLASRGATPRFDLPATAAPPLDDAAGALAFVDALAVAVQATLAELAQVGDAAVRALATRQAGITEELFTALRDALDVP
ncbi:MAG: hypothetical protein ACRD0K_19165 [Egibacteraceae bacterium]